MSLNKLFCSAGTRSYFPLPDSHTRPLQTPLRITQTSLGTICGFFLFVLLFAPKTSHASNELVDVIHSAPLEEGVSPAIQAAQLTHYLEQNGYILATVTPSEDGRLIVDPGAIVSIVVNGLRPKSEIHARNIIESSIPVDAPTEAALDHALALINDMPGVAASFAIERIDIGSYELHLSASDTAQFGGISMDTPPAESGTDYRINLFQDLTGILAGGDILRLQAVWLESDNSSNQRSILGSYQIPLGLSGGFAEFGAADFKTETEIHGRSQAFTTGAGAVILPGRVTSHDFEGRNYYINGGYPIRRSHQEAFYILGQLDFSNDETDGIGDSDIIHADSGIFYSYQWPNGESITAAGFLGVGYNDSYIEGDSSNYWSIDLAFAYIKPAPFIDNFAELRFEVVSKVADMHLPNSKLFTLGDEDFLRGYKASTFIGNSGVVGTIELAQAYYFNNSYVFRLTPYVFLDAGFVSNASRKSNSTNRPRTEELMSTGIGAHIVFAKNLYADGYVGIPLLEDDTGSTPKEEIYVRLGWSW